MKPISTVIIETDSSKREIFDNILEQYSTIEVQFVGFGDDLKEIVSDFDVLIIDVKDDLAKKGSDNLIKFVVKAREFYSDSIFMLTGKPSDTLKKALKDYIDVVSGVTANKISNDFNSCLSDVIKKKHKLLPFLTNFFTPHLVGEFGRKGFDQFLCEGFSREENLLALDDLKKRFRVFAPLLLEDNRKLVEDALSIYEERDLTPQEIDDIRAAFCFQFNTLKALENFSERRLYYLETDVIYDLWRSVIDFGREIGGGLIFGCSKNGDIVRLKIAVNNIHNLTKIGKKSYFYSKLMMVEPYGDLVVTSEGRRLVIGNDHEDAIIEEENTVFDFFIKIIKPERTRRGLMRS